MVAVPSPCCHLQAHLEHVGALCRSNFCQIWVEIQQNPMFTTPDLARSSNVSTEIGVSGLFTPRYRSLAIISGYPTFCMWLEQHCSALPETPKTGFRPTADHRKPGRKRVSKSKRDPQRVPFGRPILRLPPPILFKIAPLAACMTSSLVCAPGAVLP